MKNKSFIFLFVLVFMMVLSLSAVSADDMQTTDSGQVSGDVDVATVNPWDTTGELTYDIPAEAKDIKSADVYVNVYSGRADNAYGANANVSLKTVNGENQIASEELWIEDGSTDGTIYTVNNHTNKCYSDYQMHYDITDSLKGLNGTSIAIKVDTFKMVNKSFDGRIKLIALVLAYDDGDDDVINYWLDTTQKWSKTNITTSFDTSKMGNLAFADLYNIALSSGDGSYKVNGEFLGDAINHTSGDYYQYNYWDVSDKIKKGQNTEILTMYAGTSAYGSIKNVLTLLKAQDLVVDVSLATEYTSVATCYAGTNNTLTVTVNSNKAGKYAVELLADGTVVDSSEVELDGDNSTTVLLTDQTIRPVDETTVSGANNTKVVYTVNVKLNDKVVGNSSITVPVLYNGYLSKDFAYNATGYDTYPYSFSYTGDIVIDIKGESSYKSGAAGVNEIWTVGHDNIVKAYIYVPYNWFNGKTYIENETMFNVVFNNVTVAPAGYYRDQANMGNYGKYGYGVLIYDVTDFIETGENTFNLTKVNPTPTVYPTALIYAYNTPDSNAFKTAYIINGADLLANDYNKAGRTVKLDTEIDINPFANATLYVLASSAQKGEGNIIVNDKVFEDVWNGTTKTTDLFTADITDVANSFNNISFVATGSTILALPQIIVTTDIFADASIATEYTSVPTCYAGTNNTLTITVNANKAGTYLVELYANNFLVNSTEIELDGVNSTTVLLTDPTVRPIDETTVSGADNKNVEYYVVVKHDDIIVGDGNLTVPVLYNGYLSKDFAYNATGYEAISPITFTGDIVIDVKGESSYKSGAAGVNEIWTVGNDNIVKAYIYVPYNWFNGKTYIENETMFNVVFNNVTVAPAGYYRDQANMGNYGKYGYGVLIYDVTEIIKTGENTFNLTKVNPTPTVYPTALVYAYNATGSGVIKTAYIIEGADLLANDYNKAGRIVALDSQIDVDLKYVNDAKLYVLASSAQAGEGNIIVNGNAFENVWNGTTKTTDLYTVDITDIAKQSNDISFIATGSTILALNQIIVTTQNAVASDVSIATEYTSVPTCYAGTVNALTVTVDASQAGKYVVELLADGVVVASSEVELDGANKTAIVLIDPTIRPVDETTVSGANNTKVVYAVNVKMNDTVVGNNNISVPVLYNGYMSYEFAYNTTGYEAISPITFTGDIVIDVKGESSYKSGAAGVSEIWTVDNDNIVKAYIYVPYNWFNGNLYIENETMFNVLFNNVSVAPAGFYRDQGNLGKYGKYGYGVVIYDVTDLIAAGNNTFDLTKVNPTPTIYPSALIYAYNKPASGILKTAYFVNGADLLSNDYNNAERVIMADSNITVDLNGVSGATLYVFASSAQAGEGNVLVNDHVFKNVWNGTSKTTDVFTASIADVVNNTNKISFISTGSTILALQEIIVTTQYVPIETTVTAKALSTTYDSGKSFTITVLDEAKNPVIGLKLTLKVYTGKTSKNYYATTNSKGVATFTGASKLAIGTHKVEITTTNKEYNVKKTTSSIKVSKAKTTVKAPKVTAKVKKSKYFKVTVKNKATKKVVKSIKVKIKVYTGKKYKTYTKKTNSKGIAKLNTKSLKVGKHKVVISSGNSKYTISAKSQITIKK